MAPLESLKDPWLVAVWPGMGHVAINAGYYLMAKLHMDLLAEFSPRDLFDLDFVDVKDGLIRAGELPRSRFFSWKDPAGKRDILLFLGEAQPPQGRYFFCQRIIDFASKLNVERVFTFAAMATSMEPSDSSDVFGATTEQSLLGELRNTELRLLAEGQISGLNGVLLNAAAENNLPGTCLLGEMPQILARLPFPKASLAVLEAFQSIANIEIDLAELREQVELADAEIQKLMSTLNSIKEDVYPSIDPDTSDDDAEPEEKRLSGEQEQRLESLFEQAKSDRSKSYELKRELDRLGVFPEYEDRFLDLFKKSE